ncbi:MAG: hypothetical protein HRT47_05385 [Candidatus Caenarcaniphilales bacterium]|nr:hypothetical protein [Candidatus Caenarcaniphilales bacterium]
MLEKVISFIKTKVTIPSSKESRQINIKKKRKTSSTQKGVHLQEGVASSKGRILSNYNEKNLRPGNLILDGALEEKILNGLKSFSQEDFVQIKDSSPYIYDNYLKDEASLKSFMQEPRAKQAMVCRVLDIRGCNKYNPLKALWLFNSHLLNQNHTVDIKIQRNNALQMVLSNIDLKQNLDIDVQISKKNLDFEGDFKSFGNNYGLVKRSSEDKWILKIPEQVQNVKINSRKYEPGAEVEISLQDTYSFNSLTDKKNYVFQLVRSSNDFDTFGISKIAEGKGALAFNKLFPKGVKSISMQQKNIGSCLKLAALINNLVLDDTGVGLKSIFDGLYYERDKETGMLTFKFSSDKLSKPLELNPESYIENNGSFNLPDYEVKPELKSFRLYRSKQYKPVQGDFIFQLLEKFMIDAIEQEGIKLSPSKKQTDIMNAKGGNPEKLERDQDNKVLKIFFPNQEITTTKPSSFTFMEFAYAGMSKPSLSLKLASKFRKDLTIKQLVPEHAYVVDRVSLNEDSEMEFKLYNPHNFSSKRKNQSKRKLSLSEIHDNFDKVYLFKNKETNNSQDFYLI